MKESFDQAFDDFIAEAERLVAQRNDIELRIAISRNLIAAIELKLSLPEFQGLTVPAQEQP